MPRSTTSARAKALRTFLYGQGKRQVQRPSSGEIQRQQKQKEQSLNAAAASEFSWILNQSPVKSAQAPTQEGRQVACISQAKAWQPESLRYLGTRRTASRSARDTTWQSSLKRVREEESPVSTVKSPKKPSHQLSPEGKAIVKRYDNIETLQNLLGVGNDSEESEDAIFLALDTEFDPGACQLGLCVIDTRDFKDLKPGSSDPVSWMKRMRVQDYIFESASNLESRRDKFWFGTSRVIHASKVIPALQRLLISLAQPRLPYSTLSGAQATPPKLILVGHSLLGDLGRLNDIPAAKFSITRWAENNNIPFAHIFDTAFLVQEACERGASLSGRLGALMTHLGVKGVHVRAARESKAISTGPRIAQISRSFRQFEGVPDRHNAGNDAAYTMLALLLIAVRWEDKMLPKRSRASDVRHSSISEAQSETDEQLDTALEQSSSSHQADSSRSVKSWLQSIVERLPFIKNYIAGSFGLPSSASGPKATSEHERIRMKRQLMRHRKATRKHEQASSTPQGNITLGSEKTLSGN